MTVALGGALWAGSSTQAVAAPPAPTLVDVSTDPAPLEFTALAPGDHADVLATLTNVSRGAVSVAARLAAAEGATELWQVPGAARVQVTWCSTNWLKDGAGLPQCAGNSRLLAGLAMEPTTDTALPLPDLSAGQAHHLWLRVDFGPGTPVDRAVSGALRVTANAQQQGGVLPWTGVSLDPRIALAVVAMGVLLLAVSRRRRQAQVRSL